KQFLRQAAPPLDERAYGFAQLTDLIRAAQRDGFLRMERDRQGVVRVFQGPAYDADVATTSPGFEGQEDSSVVDAPVSMDADQNPRPAVPDEATDLEVSSPIEVPEDAVEGSDTSMAARESGPDEAGAAAPTRKRRPNRGTGRRRPAAKK